MASTASPAHVIRARPDRCPGVLRPWAADDGGLVRLRLVGGSIDPAQLRALGQVSAAYGDGDVHLTGRANLQVRGLPLIDGALPPEVVDAFVATGLLPSRTHELVRNLMVTPTSGLAGAPDLFPVARALDALLLADPAYAALPGRFLVVLDDGGGDLVGRSCDLGLTLLSPTSAQIRAGETWGPVLHPDDGAQALAGLARRFLDVRGEGPDAPWHVAELALPLLPPAAPDRRLPAPSGRLAYGAVPGGVHVEVPGGVLTPSLLWALAVHEGPLRVTPWHGVLVVAS